MKKILSLLILFAFAALNVTNAQVSKASYPSVSTIEIKDSTRFGDKWIRGVSTDSTLSAKSNDSLVTQKAIKIYVDTKVKSFGKDTSTITTGTNITVTAGELLELFTFYSTTAQTIKIGTCAACSDLVDNYKLLASTPTTLILDWYGGVTDKTIYISGISASTKLAVYKR